RSSAASSSATATSGGMNSRICPTSRSWFCPEDSPTRRNRSGWRRTTSRACVPTEPVDPLTISDRTTTRLPPRARLHWFWAKRYSKEPGDRLGEEQPDQVERRRRREDDRVDPVEVAAMTGDDAPHVLDPHVALQH